MHPPEGLTFRVAITGKNRVSIAENVSYLKEDFPRRIDGELTEFLGKAQYRFVLSWGSTPKDLDSHLMGPDPGTGGTFHISYRRMKAWGNRHFLDIDAMSGFGPETITLKNLDPGIYEYSVHDYTNSFRNPSTGLAGSNAILRLYREQELLGEYTVPSGAQGNLWRVLSIDGTTGEISLIQTLSHESPRELSQQEID